jgi:tetratricopeptide (TPR) repeat protein
VFAAAARAAPQSAPAQAGVGVALPRLNRPAEAIAYYEAALALDSRQTDAHLNAGTSRETLGRVGEAISHYQRRWRSGPATLESTTISAARCN